VVRLDPKVLPTLGAKLAQDTAIVGLAPLLCRAACVVVAEGVISSNTTRLPIGGSGPTGECVNSRKNVPANGARLGHPSHRANIVTQFSGVS
jgi:hypothetical protein